MQIFGVAAIDIARDQFKHSLAQPVSLYVRVCGFNDISVEQLQQQSVYAPRALCVAAKRKDLGHKLGSQTKDLGHKLAN